ncbi:unnamed protein product, partial [Polarella glacialis]
RAGQTRLFDAMMKAAGFLEEFVGHSGEKLAGTSAVNAGSPRKRLLVLTDGDDVGSSVTAESVASRMLASQVVVDCVVLGRDECGPLKAIAAQTGGLKFRPSSLQEALDLFEREALLSPSMRASVTPCAQQSLEKLKKASFDIINNVPLVQRAPDARALHGAESSRGFASPPADRFRRIGRD